MNALKKILVVALLLMTCALPGYSQFSFGVKAGFTLNDIKFNKNILDSDNRAGFTGGLMAQFMLPVMNIGLDGSIMYVHRSSKNYYDGYEIDDKNKDFDTSTDYIDVPINVKWIIPIPVVQSIIAPYVFTGPAFSFLLNDTKKVLYDVKRCDVSWNLGAGVQLLKKLQIGASYGWGMTETVSSHSDNIKGKNRNWTVTAAYLF